jgi:hypothetical protein
MMSAPPREAGCALELVQVDVTDPAFNQRWDVLGYVTLSSGRTLDPAAEANRSVVRPRACAMGGTSLAVTSTSSNSTGPRTGSALMYMVLRPKGAPSAPTTF